MHRIRPAVLTTGFLLAAGCSLLAPLPDRNRFFALTALPEVQAHRADQLGEASGTAAGIVCGLGPITLPAYLDRREVATRVSPTELTYSQTDRWAEPLSANVEAVLLQNLAELLGSDRVALYPWVGETRVDYQVAINLRRFERDTGGTCSLIGRWVVTDARSGSLVLAREASLTRPAPAGDTTAAAAALSGLLGDLSHEVATALQALPAPRATAQ